MYVPRQVLVLSTKFDEHNQIVVDPGETRREEEARQRAFEDTTIPPPVVDVMIRDATRNLGPWPQLQFLMEALLTVPDGHGLGEDELHTLVVAVRRVFEDRNIQDPSPAAVNEVVLEYAKKGAGVFTKDRKKWYSSDYDYWSQFKRVFLTSALYTFKTCSGIEESSRAWRHSVEPVLLAVWQSVCEDVMRINKRIRQPA